MWLALALVASISPALAAPTQAERDAEAIRLTAEVERLGQKRAWSGVDRNYSSLVALKDVTIASATHLVGAQAALEQGDVKTAWERAQHASKTAKSPEEVERAATWTADFYVNYGEVQIRSFANYRGPLPLLMKGASFSPAVKAALTHAQERLDSVRAFDGYLPMGRYTVAGHDFEVVGGPKEKVWIRWAKEGDPAAPPPEPDPDPPDMVEDRIVTLAARGGGWQADRWDALAGAVRERLYGVEGVLAVDIFGPEDPWVMVDLDPAKLTAFELGIPGVEAALRTALGAELVVTGYTVAIPPTPRPAAEIAGLTVVPGDPIVKVSDIARVRTAPAGPLPVPADTGETPRWKMEIKVSGAVSGALEAIEAAAAEPEGAAALGFTLEGPGAR